MIKIKEILGKPHVTREDTLKEGKMDLWHLTYDTQLFSYSTRLNYIHIGKMVSSSRAILFKFNKIDKLVLSTKKGVIKV